MDSLKLTLGASSSRTSHHSDEIAFSIEPVGVEPPLEAEAYPLEMIAAAALAVVNVCLVGYYLVTNPL